jgi:hypothetical protein
MKDGASSQGILSKISAKLGLLIGSGLAILSGFARPAIQTTPDLSMLPTANAATIVSTKPLPRKLMLRQTQTGFKMIAQHESHASHDSHASHASHSSHSSHVSGGFV